MWRDAMWLTLMAFTEAMTSLDTSIQGTYGCPFAGAQVSPGLGYCRFNKASILMIGLNNLGRPSSSFNASSI